MTFPWLKGHGTENDFVLLPDPDGTIHGDLEPSFVAALCARRRGIGADGVLRVIRSAAIGLPSEGEWFMDYRNADGSISEMCGNGVRVFAHHLVRAGLADPAEPIVVGTRDGDKIVTVAPGALRQAQETAGPWAANEYSVDMGPYELRGMSEIEASGRVWKAQDVRTGNPHAVVVVGALEEAGTLLEAPSHDPAVYPDGVNVEFVRRVGEGHIAMRVHERGSGETRSCGTGACAAAIAVALADGSARPANYRVDLPGGTVHVDVQESRVVLTGPAEIVAAGDLEWWA